MGDLKVYPSEKTVLVTGAASERGIGRGVARRLAAAGWWVGIIDVNAVQVEQTATAIAAETGAAVIGQGADVSESGAWKPRYSGLRMNSRPSLRL